MVSMATVNIILEHGVCMQNWSYPHLSYTTEDGLILKLKTKTFQPMASNASYLICIFMTFNENIKMTKNRCDTLFLSQ